MADPLKEFFYALSSHVIKQGTKQTEYLKKIDSAYCFAKGTEGEAWNGMFLMGLSLAGLDHIPTVCHIERETYWVRMPKPHEDAPDEWPDSWIVEVNTFKEPK